ncbi:hypothetical protein DEU56DRAFT_953205 [Suillus clintonianus]|uniref:uncharacterized protein n=1 Tax=Suillus clintonianus TaxID=1904413 RepID=UPI001B87CA30|nr:uncharacterized protein DEU56DRAFT_953205 [Suillus clintonianus]KAG2131743.1 hypothetical protein DEU56DRAFT_953205 [Suillus clintonianus]
MVVVREQGPPTPIFWTNKNKNILAAFSFTNDDPTTIYEFDASTLKTVGTPFEGHTQRISSLALSFDSTLLASAAEDNTIKLWAYESRQPLASFDVKNPLHLVLSPDSCQFAYTTFANDDYNVYICNTPPDVLAQDETSARPLNNLLNSDATRRRPAVPHRPTIPIIPIARRPTPTIHPQQPIFLRLRKFLPFSSRTNAVRPVQPHNPFDVSATLPLPSSLSGQAATRFERFEIDSPPPPSNAPVSHFLRQHLSFLMPRHSHGPPVVEVAPGRKFTRLLAAKLPEYRKVNDTRRLPGQQAGAPQDID